MSLVRALAVSVIALVAAACDRTSSGQVASASEGSAAAPAKASPASAKRDPEVVWRHPAAARVVSIGDVHGDLAATRAALRLAGLIDAGDRWVGGDAVLVQTGDMLDRGDDEQAIVDLFERLEGEAAEAGGKVVVLNGNHELMNVAGDLRYVTAGGFRDFEDAPGLPLADPRLSRFPPPQRARMAALLPGNPYAVKLARHPVVAVVGDTVFAHGGVEPQHARAVEQMNREVASWLMGASRDGMRVVALEDGPVWSRRFSDEREESDCEALQKSLEILGATRMVVGHTVQKSITSACDGKVWRIDVGMAAHYGGKPEALEIRGAEVRPIRGGD